VRVPEDAASGPAKVTVSFPDWKEAKIAPATFDIVLEDLSPEKEAEEEQQRKQAETERDFMQLMILPDHIDSLKKQLDKTKDPMTRRQLQAAITQTEKALEDVRKKTEPQTLQRIQETRQELKQSRRDPKNP
jgi:hypothetical protein